MNNSMRRHLAQQPFEDKIRKVGQLLNLSANVKPSRVREEPPTNSRTSRCVQGDKPSVENKL